MPHHCKLASCLHLHDASSFEKKGSLVNFRFEIKGRPEELGGEMPSQVSPLLDTMVYSADAHQMPTVGKIMAGDSSKATSR